MTRPKTLFEKVWDAHVVKEVAGGAQVLYIDAHLIHEVTSPVAFNGLRRRGIPVFRPEQTVATADHNIPTLHQDKPIRDALSAQQLAALRKNCEAAGIELYDIGHVHNGIVHVIGPELGITQPGMTLVCGDSHTATHGAFGSIAFGIGTSEVEMVLATQCLFQTQPKTMRISVEGDLHPGVTAKDLILYIISRLSASGATGYFVEYAGTTLKNLGMEERMTVCNMSIEMGARGGMMAPDQTTFDYLRGKAFSPKDPDWDRAVAHWKTLPSDPGAQFDKEYRFKAEDITPVITFGTNPGMGMPIDAEIPSPESVKDDAASFQKALAYMGFCAGEKLLGKPIDYVFLGSCTNGRIGDFRRFATLVKGHRKAKGVSAWLVPGSKAVERQICEAGIDSVLKAAGFALRQPGCSACLGMNEDKIPAGKYAVSTSNRNFEGRQGPGARTLLASPLVAAAAAITGKISDPRDFI